MAKTQVDTWFCVDMIFSSYKILIILHQSKKGGQEEHRLPPQTVDISRKSIQAFQSLLGPTLHAYWGIRYVQTHILLKLVSRAINNYPKSSLLLLQQFIPFFILSLDIIGNPEHEDIETDLSLVSWINDRVEEIADERVELRPVMIIMKAMMIACNQTARDRLACSTSSHSLRAA
jgi:hypothetical protein